MFNKNKTELIKYPQGKTNKSYSIPSTVTSVNDSAFEDCTGLTSVTIPNSVTEIGDYAFEDCTGLTSVTIPNSVTSIGDSAFSRCKSLTSVTIPNSVTSIGDFAFSRCKSLTSVTIPNSVTEIGDSAFYGCTGLTSVTIPNSVTSIGGYAFSGCTDLTSVTIPNSVTEIGYDAFSGCTGLTSVTIPNSVTSIGSSAFYGCTSLTSITIPNSVTSIGGYAFYGCTGLTSVTIPDSVTSIRGSAFDGCSKLTAINVSSGNKKYTSVNGVLFNKNKTELIKYPQGKTNKSYSIPSTVTSVNDSAFYGCTSLTSVTIPNSVTEIGYGAFSGCTGLTSTTIPDSVTEIGDSAFYGCKGLTSVTIPNSVTEIGYGAFSGCTGLTSVTIPNSVTEIGRYAFYGCSKLTAINVSSGNKKYTSVDGVLFNKNKTKLIKYPEGKKDKSYSIPSTVTSVNDSAFSGCTGLTSVTIPNSVTNMESSFHGCTKLNTINVAKDNTKYTSVNGVLFNKAKTKLITYPPAKKSDSYSIPNTVNDITGAFFGCTQVKSVTIPNSVTEIGYSAFRRCTGLTSVNISNIVTDIAYKSFDGCKNLESVELPSNLKSLDSEAFTGCESLASISISESNKYYSSQNGVLFNKNKTELVKYSLGNNRTSYTIPNTVKTISTSAFKDSGKLKSVTIPNTVTNIKTDAFWNCTGLTSITIPNSVTSIGGFTFCGCTGLTSVTIPNSVTEIGWWAFGDCKNLKTVQVGKNADMDMEALGYYGGVSDPKKISGFTIYGISGSPAQTYAKDNGFKFVNVTKPGIVKLSGVANVSTGVKVSWSKVDNISTYTVYRKSGSDDYKAIKSGLTGAYYTDTTAKSGTTYTYTVRATNIAGTGGYDKTGKSVICITMPKPSVTNANGGVTVKWSKVTGAKGYYVYRKTGSNGWSKIADVTTTSYTDKSAKSGTTYAYTVKAYNGKTVSAYNTTGISIKYLSMPKLSSVTNVNGGVTVKWGKVTGAGGYYVYRKTGSGGWSKIATVSGNSKVSYTDKTAKSGTTYKYTVRAYSGKTVSAYNTTGLSIKYLAVPKLASVSSAKSGVTFKWNKVTGASGYYVYRKTGSGGWSKIATVSGNSKVSYTDKTAKSGTTYKYTVRAYSGKTVSAYNTTGLKIKDKY